MSRPTRLATPGNSDGDLKTCNSSSVTGSRTRRKHAPSLLPTGDASGLRSLRLYMYTSVRMLAWSFAEYRKCYKCFRQTPSAISSHHQLRARPFSSTMPSPHGRCTGRTAFREDQVVRRHHQLPHVTIQHGAFAILCVGDRRHRATCYQQLSALLCQ